MRNIASDSILIGDRPRNLAVPGGRPRVTTLGYKKRPSSNTQAVIPTTESTRKTTWRYFADTRSINKVAGRGLDGGLKGWVEEEARRTGGVSAFTS